MRLSLFIAALYFSISFIHAQDVTDIYNEGMDKANAGKFEQAIKLFSKVIEKEPNHNDVYLAYYNRAISKMFLEDYKGAILDFDMAVLRNSTYLNIFLNRGTAKKRLKDYVGAIADYSFVIAKDSLRADAFYNRGLVYNLTDKGTEACKDWDKASSLGLKEAANAISQYCVRKEDKSVVAKFKIVKLTKEATDEKYGFTPEFPIKVGGGVNSGARNQRDYLDLLRGSDGKPVEYIRKGSCCAYPSENGLFGTALIDRYEITYKNSNGKKTTSILYISFYDYEEPLIPLGLKTIE